MTMTFADKKRKILKLRAVMFQQLRVARPIHVPLVWAHTHFATHFTTHRASSILTRKDDEERFYQGSNGSTQGLWPQRKHMGERRCLHTISDDKQFLLWIVFRHSVASAAVCADRTVFQPIHDHFEESLCRIRNNRTGKGKGEEQRPTKGKGKEKGKTHDSRGKGGRADLDFNFDCQRPFYIKYVKVDKWVQHDEDYVKTVPEKFSEEARIDGMYVRSLSRQHVRRHPCHPNVMKDPLEPIQYMRSVMDSTVTMGTLRQKIVFSRSMKVVQGYPHKESLRIPQPICASSIHKIPPSAQILC